MSLAGGERDDSWLERRRLRNKPLDSNSQSSSRAESLIKTVTKCTPMHRHKRNTDSSSDKSITNQPGATPLSKTVRVVARCEEKGGEGMVKDSPKTPPYHYSNLITLLCVVMCTVVFFCASRLGFTITVGAVSLFWTGNAMGVFFLIYAPIIEWPFYLCGMSVAFYMARICLAPELLLAVKLGFATLAEIIMIATFLKRKLGRDLYDPYVVDKESLLLDLIVFPSIIAPCLVSLFGTWAVVECYPGTNFYRTFITWLFADFSGNYFTLYILLVARCTLHDTPRTWSGWRELRSRITYKHYFRLVEYILCLGLLSVIFVGSRPFFVVLIMFPIQAWVAMRFPQALSAFILLWIGGMIAISLKVEKQLWGVAKEELIEQPVETSLIIAVHLTVFVSVFCSQFISTNINAKNRAIEGMRLAAKEKESFFQHVTHEFRTPLSVVLGFSHELLQRNIEDQEVIESIQHINSACTVLSATVDDMLEIFKLNVGNVKLVQNPTIMFNFMSECHHVLNKYADSLQKHLTIDVQIAPDVPQVLVLANSRLAQIVLNLGSNAIKYTRDGGTVLVSLGVECTKNNMNSGIIPNEQPATDTIYSTAHEEGVEMFPRDEERGLHDSIHTHAHSIEPVHKNISSSNNKNRSSTVGTIRHGVEVCVGAIRGRGGGDSPTSSSLAPLRQDSGLLRGDLGPLRQDLEAPPPRGTGEQCGTRPTRSSSKLTDPAAPDMYLVLTVTDTGVGIPSALLDTVFERFNRCDGYVNATMAQGTGLGLTVTKQVVELMKGELYVTSTYGVGSTFVVTIPVKYAHADEHMQPSTQNPAQSGSESTQTEQIVPVTVPPLSILVVEDQLLNQKLLRAGLVRMGHTVEVACNGRVALEMSMHPNAIYDVMLLDLGLPEVSGDQVLQRLRASSPPQSRIPILITSAEVMSPESTAAFKEKGADGMCPKPYTAATLEAGLKQLIASGRLQVKNKAPGTPAPAPAL